MIFCKQNLVHEPNMKILDSQFEGPIATMIISYAYIWGVQTLVMDVSEP